MVFLSYLSRTPATIPGVLGTTRGAPRDFYLFAMKRRALEAMEEPCTTHRSV